jgi:predicted DNA-binding ribbon-helix-helix protein
MSGPAKSQPGLEELFRQMDAAGAEPFFRAVTADGKRRGMRLEREFWTLLEKVGREESATVGEIVAMIEASGIKSTNLTSAVRVFVAQWLEYRLGGLREKMSPAVVNGLINACPSPAFALSATRQLRFHNPAFLRFIRMNMPSEEMDQMERNLRLQIDMHMEDLLAALREGDRTMVPLGFAIGVNERRVRGRLNAVLAPCWNEDMIIGYVIT